MSVALSVDMRAMAVVLLVGCGGAQAVHSYPVDRPVLELIRDDVAFAAFAARVRPDLGDDHIGTLAILDYLAGDDERALARLTEQRARATSTIARRLVGVHLEPLIAARRAPKAAHLAAFRAELERIVATWPYDEMRGEIRELAIQADFFYTPNQLAGYVLGELEPSARKGPVSLDDATRIIYARFAYSELLRTFPVTAEIMRGLIAMDRATARDLWAERDVGAGSAPVVVGIWDFGVDATAFPDRDVSGIAYDLDAQPTTGLLAPLAVGREGELLRLGKAFLDVECGVVSDEAVELRRTLATIAPERMPALWDDLQLMDRYVHGTLVAGVALRGNPTARLRVARITEEWRSLAEPVTAERAAATARMYAATVAYFREQGARVVDMSWVVAAGTMDAAPYRTESDALRRALAGAPDILFVASAGSDDRASIPSAFTLPNLVSVGALDDTGHATSVTRLGAAFLYANGYEVEGPIPGGKTARHSGGGVATAQVTNVAAKLFSLHPDATVADVRSALLEGSEARVVDGHPLHLLDARRAAARLR